MRMGTQQDCAKKKKSLRKKKIKDLVNKSSEFEPLKFYCTLEIAVADYCLEGKHILGLVLRITFVPF